MTMFEDVVRWHREVGHPVEDKVAMRPGPSTALAWDLVEEEYQELIGGFQDRDEKVVADSIADLVWVLCGMSARWGINLDAVWAEVKRANFEKLGGPVRADGKILKPEGWKPPDILKALQVPIGED